MRKKNRHWLDLIPKLPQYPESLEDYRVWPGDQGIDTNGIRPGSAEGTMRLFTGRLKNSKSWSEQGITPIIHIMVALKDGLEI